MQHLGGKLALKSACRIALNCPARNTVGSMETQPREPDTRANVAAWVTYAASLSGEERQAHYCNCEITAQYERPSICCPLCNAIAKLRGSSREQRRSSYRTAYGKHNASRVALKSFARADEIEDHAIEAHADRICREAVAAGHVEELVSWVLAEMEGSEEERASLLAMAEECEEELSGIIASIVRMKMQHYYEASAYTPLAFTAYAHDAARHGNNAQSAVLNRMLLLVAVFFRLLLAMFTRYASYAPPLETLIFPAKSNTRLVVSMVRAPRAPQPCPCRGNIPAVVPMAD